MTTFPHKGRQKTKLPKNSNKAFLKFKMKDEIQKLIFNEQTVAVCPQ